MVTGQVSLVRVDGQNAALQAQVDQRVIWGGVSVACRPRFRHGAPYRPQAWLEVDPSEV